MLRRAGSSPVTRTILNADTDIFGVFLCLKIKKSTITGRLHPVIEEMFNEGKLINRDISDIWEAITECVIYYNTIIRYIQYVNI